MTALITGRGFVPLKTDVAEVAAISDFAVFLVDLTMGVLLFLSTTPNETLFFLPFFGVVLGVAATQSLLPRKLCRAVDLFL